MLAGHQPLSPAPTTNFWPFYNNRLSGNSQTTPPLLPAWMTNGPPPIGQQPTATTFNPHQCPELVFRQIKWPATEAGHVVHMACPSHAHPSIAQGPAAQLEANAVSRACLAPPAGSPPGTTPTWAPHLHAARCKSIWLTNLTERLKFGDSPISILSELVQQTRPQQQQQPATTPLTSAALAHHWSPSMMMSSQFQQQQQQPARLELFGDDLVQVGSIVKRLVEYSSDLLNGIGDEKQRIGFTREIAQVSGVFFVCVCVCVCSHMYERVVLVLGSSCSCC